MSSNLPPGISESDIPGNRPEDFEWEFFHEQIDNDCYDIGLTVEEARLAWSRGVDTITAIRNKEQRDG